jgi:prolyl oligopeptidase
VNAPRLAALALLPALAAVALAGGAKPDYPKTRTDDVVDDLHGVKVPDPYRWLEPNDAPEVEAWDEAQNAFLRARLDAVPGRAEIRKSLDEELDQGGMPSLPRFRGGKRWTTYLPPGKNQPVLYANEEEGKGLGSVVVDPNEWSRDGTDSMNGWEPSPDGRYVAYRRAPKGSEDTTLYVRDVASGKDLPDRITRTKFSGIVWSPDSSGFLYERMPDPDSVPQGEAQYHRRVLYHRLGSVVLDDTVVFGAGRDMIESYGAYLTTDERHVLMGGGVPYKAEDTYAIDWQDGKPVVSPVLVGHDSRTFVDRVGDLYLLNTDFEAPRRRLCVAKVGEAGDPSKWKEILPQGKGVLQDAVPVGDAVLVHLKENVVSRLRVIGLDGSDRGEVTLPRPGSVGGLQTKPGDTRVWFSFESYDVPPTNYVCDVASKDRALTVTDRLPTKVDVDALTSEQTTYRSKDGTEIPIFLLYRKDAPPDGTRPTILYGYGGFRVGLFPRFSRSRALLASEKGWVWAYACLRGGDEFGEAWHEAGSMGNKQNVFDDFIAAADWLVSSKRASRDRLAIWGGSNGGLLVAACVDQRPDLCRAAICSVPLTDMLRFHRFQYAKSWTMEYGSPDDAKAFEWLRAYSPYHNVKDGAAYPAVLVTAGLEDGRVDAFHARKIVARWQAATSSDRPILLYLDRRGGHGASGLTRAKDELTDELCFLTSEIGAGATR